MDRQLTLTSVLLVHLAGAVLHGYSHSIVPVELSVGLNAAVLLTVFIGPIAGVVLARRQHPYAYPLFTGSMVAAFLIGGTLHFLLENPDHVSRLPASPAGQLFELSAIAVLVTPAIGALYGTIRWMNEGT